MRLKLSMPTDASVAPRVPPSTIRKAGMSMNAAGEVPLMIPPTRMPKAATTIPMTVAAFISIVQSAGAARTSGAGSRVAGRKGEGGHLGAAGALGEQWGALAHRMAGGAQLA